MSLLDFLRPKPKIQAPLRFRNTLSGEKEVFAPLSPREVRMYNCGPTVYDFQHIGNLRPYVFADVLRRALILWGYSVKQVINITDVGHLVSDADEGEDKVEKGARARGKTVEEVVTEVAEAFFADLDAMNINRKPIIFSRATHYIEEQIALTKALEEKGYTYTIADGVYFDTSKFKEYGKLGRIHLEGLQEGARIGETEGKRNPTDFALWKFSPKSEQRQQEWQSPWGIGFPGWHLECTAMIFKLLGKQIDIHTGGIDHIPVHHNNEIAQAEGATGKQYVKYWMHNAFITIEGKKISKSLGNTIYLRGIIERGFNPLAYRYLLLTAHYHSPVNFTWSALEAAGTALTRLQRLFFEDLPKHGEATPAFVQDFTEAIGDDLDTPRALALAWDTIRDPLVTPEQKHGNLLFADKILGLGLNRKPSATISLSVTKAASLPEHVREKLELRETARKGKNFAESDRLRDQIRAEGYEIDDTPEGPAVRKI